MLGDGSIKFKEIVHSLIDAGYHINIPDDGKITALQHAKIRGFVEIVSLLEQLQKIPAIVTRAAWSALNACERVCWWERRTLSEF